MICEVIILEQYYFSLYKDWWEIYRYYLFTYSPWIHPLLFFRRGQNCGYWIPRCAKVRPEVHPEMHFRKIVASISFTKHNWEAKKEKMIQRKRKHIKSEKMSSDLIQTLRQPFFCQRIEHILSKIQVIGLRLIYHWRKIW